MLSDAQNQLVTQTPLKCADHKPKYREILTKYNDIEKRAALGVSEGSRMPCKEYSLISLPISTKISGNRQV